jgi:hypothetical protein
MFVRYSYFIGAAAFCARSPAHIKQQTCVKRSSPAENAMPIFLVSHLRRMLVCENEPAARTKSTLIIHLFRIHTRKKMASSDARISSDAARAIN